MNKILLPVDGSKRSLRTVEMVQRLCDPAESDITIVKVHYPFIQIIYKVS